MKNMIMTGIKLYAKLAILFAVIAWGGSAVGQVAHVSQLTSNDNIAKLQNLKQAYESGLIDKEEYDYAKKLCLDEMVGGSKGATTVQMGGSRRIDDLGMELCWIGPGSFRMGYEHNKNESPARSVDITKGYWMGKTEVTQDQYLKVMGHNPSHYTDPGPDAPVEWVSWTDAFHFCEKLSKREEQTGRLPVGYTYRLPTEAEWEYAARGGPNAGDHRFRFAGSDELAEVAWFLHTSHVGSKIWGGSHRTHSVAQKMPNALGIYDMSGNVWEWCLDWYQHGYAGLQNANPVGPSKGNSRVLRGGGFSTAMTVGGCRVAYRHCREPSYKHPEVGFRIVLGPLL